MNRIRVINASTVLTALTFGTGAAVLTAPGATVFTVARVCYINTSAVLAGLTFRAVAAIDALDGSAVTCFALIRRLVLALVIYTLLTLGAAATVDTLDDAAVTCFALIRRLYIIFAFIIDAFLTLGTFAAVVTVKVSAFFACTRITTNSS